jgi:hypothetical protein
LDKWSYKELKILRDTANSIRNYVDNVTGGQGKKWMDEYIKPLFVHGELPGNNSFVPFSGVVHLASSWSISFMPERHVTHELGHVLDNETGSGTSVWWSDGWSSELTKFVGGNPNSIPPHWANGSGNIPKDNQWKPERAYGNNSTADYFSEVFAFSVYPDSNQHIPNLAQIWFQTMLRLSVTK